MSEGNEDSYNNSERSKRKDDVVKAEYVEATKTLTETYKDGTTSEKKVEIVRDDDSPFRNASRNDALADFKSRARFREINSVTTDTTKQADNKGDTSDS